MTYVHTIHKDNLGLAILMWSYSTGHGPRSTLDLKNPLHRFMYLGPDFIALSLNKVMLIAYFNLFFVLVFYSYHTDLCASSRHSDTLHSYTLWSQLLSQYPNPFCWSSCSLPAIFSIIKLLFNITWILLSLFFFAYFTSSSHSRSFLALLLFTFLLPPLSHTHT